MSKAIAVATALVIATCAAVVTVVWIMDEPVSNFPAAQEPAPAKQEAPAEPVSEPQAPAEDKPEGTCWKFERQPEDASYAGQALEFEDAGVPVYLRAGESCVDSRGYKWGG